MVRDGRQGKSLKAKGAAPLADARALPAEPPGFDFSSMLAVADMLPVHDRLSSTSDRRYRFINKPLAEWFERPRSTILGLTMRELLGEEAYAVREPLDRRPPSPGERQVLRRRLHASDPRAAGGPDELYSLGRCVGRRCAGSC